MSESDLVERLRQTAKEARECADIEDAALRASVETLGFINDDARAMSRNGNALRKMADECEKAAAEIERLRAATQWQPIDTAPDKESVLVFIPNTEHYGPGIYRGLKGTFGQWMTNAVAMGRDCGTNSQPTHWMPLPPPPREETGNE